MTVDSPRFFPRRYALAGLAAGAVFPLLAWGLDAFVWGSGLSWGAIAALHRQNAAYWILDAVPFVTSLGAVRLGRQTAERERQRQYSARQRQALVELAKNKQADRDTWFATLQAIAATAARTLSLDRCGVWVYDDRRRYIECLVLYDRASDRLGSGERIPTQAAPDYFAALDRDRTLAVSDARRDDRTVELRETYLKTTGIAALLDAPIRLRGQTAGIVCCEQRSRRPWSLEEEAFAASVADFAALALQDRDRAKVQMARWESEERFRWLSEATVEGIVIHTAGTILDANHALANLSGYSVEELVGMNPLDPIDPQTRKAVAAAIDGRSGQTCEARILRKDGSTIPIEVEGRSLSYNGREVGVAAIRDITERKRAERALRDSEARYRVISELTSDYIYAARIGDEGDRRINEWATQAFERITGYSSEEMDGAGNWLELVYPEDLPRVKAFQRELLERREGSLEYRILTRSQEVRWIRDYARLQPDSRNRILGAVQDITIAKAAEIELRQAKDAAEASNRAKSAFLASVSHELRTPLNAILGYSEILLEEARENNDAQTAEDLDKIRAAGAHLLALINDILNISKIEAGKMKLLVEPFDLKSFLYDVAAAMEPLVAENNNDFEWSCDEKLGEMEGDITKIRQILMNLLGNAAKFTQNGTVMLRASRDRDEVAFIVCDTGIGISEERRERLFEAFTQGDASTSREYGGTGLGLAISQRLCQLMGGRIEVESEVGVGSTFTAILPVRQTARTFEGVDTI